MISEVANRYGRALYELASVDKKQDQIFSELRVLSEAVQSDPSIQQFFDSPIVKAEEKIAVIKSAVGQKLSPEILQTLDLLAHKNRLSIFTNMVNAFEAMSDEAHGVSRGTVKSSRVLSATAKKQIEDKVAEVTKKKVILNFSEDPNILGGLVAHVGSWTFDDSLETHLTRMSEELNRRTN